MFKRRWYWGLVILVSLGVGGSFLFLKPKATKEPVKIYTAVTPDPQSIPTQETVAHETDTSTPHNHDHSHGHSHEAVPHTHEAETNTSSGGYDWQDDGVFESSSDPWEQIYPEQESPNTDDTYPPRDWYKTEDPILYAQYLRAQLIKQFGDISQVHIFVEWQKKRRQGLPIRDAAEYIAFLEAQYYLWPSEMTLSTLKTFQEEKASGVQIIFEK
ncbi:hypothetical protein C6496_15475 [Candidatus Poribacteria bacterium]|nr:MAG: hypothetical protein C6496_15475 [Candidatus Poribacteria bacterium]